MIPYSSVYDHDAYGHDADDAPVTLTTATRPRPAPPRETAHEIPTNNFVSTRRTSRRAVTELAVVLPVILLIVLGIIDFAQVMYAHGTVSEAARVGARYAIVHGSASRASVGPTPNDTTVQSQVQENHRAGPEHLESDRHLELGRSRQRPELPGDRRRQPTYKLSLTVGRIIGLNVTVSGTTTMIITH